MTPELAMQFAQAFDALKCALIDATDSMRQLGVAMKAAQERLLADLTPDQRQRVEALMAEGAYFCDALDAVLGEAHGETEPA